MRGVWWRRGIIVIVITCDRGDECIDVAMFLAPADEDTKPLLPLPDTNEGTVLPLYSALAGVSADAVCGGIGNIVRAAVAGARVAGACYN